MKKVLILVISSDFEPYSTMITTSRNTWDSVDVDGVESIFYCSQKDNPNWKNTDKVMYFDTGNELKDMMYKNSEMFQWALQNKEFDYVCRVNASCYVNKKELIKFAQTLPNDNVFVGAIVKDLSGYSRSFYWGGCSFWFSRDVLQKIVDNRQHLDCTVMEDQGLSYMIDKLGIPCIPAKSCSIDNMGSGVWRLLVYGGGDSFEFKDFEDVKKAEGQFLFRIKQDHDRKQDEVLMKNLFKVLQ